MIGDRLEQYTYKYLMSWALSLVPEGLDKREGSIIYDALAPFCQVVAGVFMELRGFYVDTFALTATGEALDNRVAEQGITRFPATQAIKLGYFANGDNQPMDIPIGSRFSTVSETSPVNYTVIAQYTDEGGVPLPGYYQLQCEEAGTVGNQYSGNLVNITFIKGLALAEMSTTLVPARDEETDDELRERYFDSLNQKAFGGNIADYRKKVLDIAGVGAVQIYPVWNGGGTVKVSIIDAEYEPVSDEFRRFVQDELDPENDAGYHGDGLGIAPIGHQVTVTTPTRVPVNISATLQLAPGYTLSSVQTAVESAVRDHLLALRHDWDKATPTNTYATTIFIARLSSIILGVTGIVNVTNIRVNGSATDVSLTENKTTQQIPVFGEVVLSV